VVNVAVQEMLNREASSVLSTAVSFLTIYRYDVITQVIRRLANKMAFENEEHKQIHKHRLLLMLYLLSFTYAAGYRVNTTTSLPLGLWREEDGVIERGDYAVWLPSEHLGYRLAVERGYLEDGMPMLKKVAALEGDVVSYDVEERCVTVNGLRVPFAAVLSADSAGRSLAATRFPARLKHGEAWLASENIRGFDSRYFGAVSMDKE
jgi:conjugative transfer signal peptidase TraF